VRTDRVFLSGIDAEIPPVVPAREAVARGMYDREAWKRDGWTAAAVAGDTPAPDLAVSAACRAIAQSGIEPGEFGLLFHACCVHQGPDGWSAASYVQRHTIGGHAPAIEIRQYCNGMLAALELAAAYLIAGDQRAALVTGADNFGTPLVDRWRYAEGAGTNRGSIFGDAGSAMVITRRRGLARLLAVGSMSLPELEEMYRGDRALFPPGCTVGQTMNIGARMAEFAARRPDAFASAKRQLQQARTALAERVLAEARTRPGDIARATHVFSGGAEYVRSVLEPIGIDPARGVLEFGRGVGHLGVSDHIAALSHLLTSGEIGPGDRVLMVGNGIGVVISCAVLEISDAPASRHIG
jgi:3-oxoacyl-[acyl-carrier-protein] synthase III